MVFTRPGSLNKKSWYTSIKIEMDSCWFFFDSRYSVLKNIDVLRLFSSRPFETSIFFNSLWCFFSRLSQDRCRDQSYDQSTVANLVKSFLVLVETFLVTLIPIFVKLLNLVLTVDSKTKTESISISTTETIMLSVYNIVSQTFHN